MAKQTKPRLGRGLSSLIGQPVEVAPVAPAAPATRTITEHTSEAAGDLSGTSLRSIAIAEVLPSPFQPRANPTDADLETLAASIRASGVMQPIAARPIAPTDPRHRSGARWELVAGERRWRAAQIAGLEHLPALVVDLSDQHAAEWALVENVQRSDLSPIERASALARLADRFGLSHAELAERVGLDRSTVTNLIRLNDLEPEIKALLGEAGGLTVGHAKALLSIPPGKNRVKAAQLAATHGWSVRRLEGFSSEAAGGKTPSAAAPRPGPSAHIADIEKQLADHLATRVRLRTDAAGKKGRIIIEFYDPAHFEGLIKALGVDLQS